MLDVGPCFQCAISAWPTSISIVARMEGAGTRSETLAEDVAAKPDPGQRATEQAAEQEPVDAAEHPVTDAGNRGERYGMGDIRAHDVQRRHRRVAKNRAVTTKAPAPTEEIDTSHAEHRASDDGEAAVRTGLAAEARAKAWMRLRKISATAVRTSADAERDLDQAEAPSIPPGA